MTCKQQLPKCELPTCNNRLTNVQVKRHCRFCSPKCTWEYNKARGIVGRPKLPPGERGFLVTVYLPGPLVPEEVWRAKSDTRRRELARDRILAAMAKERR